MNVNTNTKLAALHNIYIFFIIFFKYTYAHVVNVYTHIPLGRNAQNIQWNLINCLRLRHRIFIQFYLLLWTIALCYI